MAYIRVIPRDLFNESKLLKCMGQLSLLIHEGRGIRWPLTLEHEDDDCGFAIEQDDSSGGLFVANLTLCVNGEPIALSSEYNSKEPYPLRFDDIDTGGSVLNDDGSLSNEFKEYLDSKV